MKQPERLTLEQKKIVSRAGLNPFQWMIRHEGNTYLHIVNKQTKEIKVIDKEKGEVVERAADQIKEATYSEFQGMQR